MISPNPRHGKAVADDIVAHKTQLDVEGSGVWWMKHPDQPENQAASYKFGLSGGFGVSRIVEYVLMCWEAWELFKVFDSKTEIENSDEEVEYDMTTGVDLDGPGTTGVMCHSL